MQDKQCRCCLSVICYETVGLVKGKTREKVPKPQTVNRKPKTLIFAA